VSRSRPPFSPDEHCCELESGGASGAVFPSENKFALSFYLLVITADLFSTTPPPNTDRTLGLGVPLSVGAVPPIGV